MKLHNLLVIALFYLSLQAASAQSLVKTADSKSGILVGSQNGSDFAGVTYEKGSDEYIFNYKFNQQKNWTTGDNTYPDFRALNIELGYDLAKNKSGLLGDKKWQGGLQAGATFSYTWDYTSTSTKTATTSNRTVYTKVPGGTVEYQTQAECNARENGGPCSAQTRTTTHYVPNPVKQGTFFVSVENELARINVAEQVYQSNDSVFLNLKDNLKNSLTVSSGYYFLLQLHERSYLSLGLSANLRHTNRSNKKLEVGNILPTDKVFYNSEDSSRVDKTGEVKEYSFGKLQQEIEVIPRFDLFYRYKLGTEKPLLGVIGSISPVFSDLSQVDPRWNFAVGPSFSLPGFPDQVLFALMSEWLEDKKGNINYSLTFHASFPIQFK